MSVTLNEKDVRELRWVADVLEAAANGEPVTQGYEVAARELSKVIADKLPEPYEQFGPGDLVESTGDRLPDGRQISAGSRLALASTGFVNLNVGTFFEYGQNDGSILTLDQVTSQAFKQVTA